MAEQGKTRKEDSKDDVVQGILSVFYEYYYMCTRHHASVINKDLKCNQI